MSCNCLPMITPTRKILQTTVNTLKLKPGINEAIMFSLKKRIENLPEEDGDVDRGKR